MPLSVRRATRCTAAAAALLTAAVSAACSASEPAGTFVTSPAPVTASAAPTTPPPVTATPTRTTSSPPAGPTTTPDPKVVVVTPSGYPWSADETRALATARRYTDLLIAQPSAEIAADMRQLSNAACDFCQQSVQRVEERASNGVIYKRDLSKPIWGRRLFSRRPSSRAGVVNIRLEYVQPPLKLLDRRTGKVLEESSTPMVSTSLIAVSVRSAAPKILSVTATT